MRKLLIVIAVAVVGIAVVLARAFWPLAPVKLIVSRETTYFTGPLNADGTVNYVAAYNDAAAEGVTPENNLAIPILQVLGREALPEETRGQTLTTLGIELPPEGDYFVTLDEHLAANAAKYEALLPPEEADGDVLGQMGVRVEIDPALAEILAQVTPLEKLANEQLTKATSEPWLAEEYPILADWLETNASAIDSVVANSTRTRYFVPMVSPADPPEYQFGPSGLVERATDLYRALACRTMLRVSQRDVPNAWRNALAMWRMGRSFGGVGYGIGGFVGVGLRHSAASALTAMAHNCNLSAGQSAKMLKDCLDLQRAGSWVEVDLATMRIKSLDFVMQTVRNSSALASQTGLSVPASATIDANYVLGRINRMYDDAQAAASQPDVPTRLQRCEAVATSFRAWLEEQSERFGNSSPLRVVGLCLSSSSGKRQYLNDAVLYSLLALMMSDVQAFSKSEARLAMHEELAEVALALAAYRARHDRYPSELSALVPDYLPTSPTDLFTGGILGYESDGASYRLYSVGSNLVADGDAEDSDDLVVESPCDQ